MYACERDIFQTVSPINFKLIICVHIIQRTDAIDFGPYGKNKMAAIKLFKMYAIDTHCECDIFRIVSPMDF